jgi:outer membrane protein assembly factor BamD
MMKLAASLILLPMVPLAVVAQTTQQPDKVLYDTAVSDIQHGRYQRARIELQTLVNTYDTSPLAPAALFAIADSWYREGGARNLDQSEKQCQDLIAQYPNAPAAAEAKQLLKKIAAARAPK